VAPVQGGTLSSTTGSASLTVGKAVVMTSYKVGYLIGSLAKASINRTLPKALIRVAPPDFEFDAR
jgi:hypothetical protein